MVRLIKYFQNKQGSWFIWAMEVTWIFEKF